jgi:hypothetical protein
MSPTVIIDHHLDLLARFSDSRFAEVIADGFMQSHFSVGTNQFRRQDQENAVVATSNLRKQVATAYNYRVTADMCQLLHHAAESLDDTDLADATLAPTQAGLVRFDVPVEIFEVRGRRMLAHWLVWGSVPSLIDGKREEVTMLTWFNDNDFPDDVGREGVEGLTAEYMDAVMGRWNWIGSEIMFPDANLGPARIETPDQVKEAVRAEGDTPSDDTTNLKRYAHALWLMLNQTITKVDIEKPERAGRRRAEKKQIPAQVSVIKLRKTAYPEREHGESEIEWSRRWFVRGHWAWRNCSAYLEGAQPYERGYRRRVYIAGYVKGPEDAPLVITDKVYSLEE